MPGLQADGVVAALGSPIKKSRLSLKFFQKKETKRALDFSDTHVEEQNTQPLEAEEPTSCDQVVPAPCPTSPPTCERKENLVPFVGLNNLGNTCYLNSILQVLYYCPGFKEAIKKLYKLSKYRDKLKETAKNEYGPQPEGTEEGEEVPAPVELLGSFYSLITSVEQLQSSFLLQPNKYNEGELATPPRLLLNSLRQLNPMYEGYLQHDAQEVLQCILGYVEEACETICKEKQSESSGKAEVSNQLKTPPEEEHGADGQLCGKRKSDTEAGNAKKKPKSQSKSRGTDDITTDQEQQPLTRSKRKSSGDITTEGTLEAPLKDAAHEREIAKESEKEKEGVSDTEEGKTEKGPRENGKRKKRARLGWLKTSSVKQPSIFSKFRSMGRLSSTTSTQAESKENDGRGGTACENTVDSASTSSHQEQHEPKDLSKSQSEEVQSFDALKRLFQGQLVLRTRCLECECFTERREDFQDISVPVQEDGPAPRETSSEVSPEPKAEVKTLRWAISQFASVERIVGEDKYFCETCHHYTEAERSLLFDKTPEVITIHLKCFAANTSEMDPYAGLSKVNTPLQTPLQLSLEEWSTGAAPRGQQYQLFAVVMHSGITISSGHYTTYIRMSDLHKINIKEEKGFDEEERTKEFQTPKREMMGSGMANGAGQDYDDGEVSFSLNGRCMSTTPIGPALPGAKGAGKKTLEGVALLGGQRSLTTTYELGSGGVKQAQQQGPGMDKSGFSASSQALSSNGSCGAVKQERDTMAIAETGEQACQGSDPTLLNLLDYEGKWLLFDDSEVRLFEEEDFLRACSPETCSTSTPYLLFYRKVEGQK